MTSGTLESTVTLNGYMSHDDELSDEIEKLQKMISRMKCG